MNKKQIIRKYLGKIPFFIDLRKKSILKDNINIQVWEKNMQLLEADEWDRFDLRKDVYPLVRTIIDGASGLPPMLYKSTDRNWFIAAYPDVIMYFYPSVDLELTEQEEKLKRQECDPNFQKLLEHLEKFKLKNPHNLLYMKNFYKETLKKNFLLSKSP